VVWSTRTLLAGSGNPPHAAHFFAAAVAALRVLGARGILLTKHPEQLPAAWQMPEHVAHFTFAGLEALLPRCKAVVYNGGIGTLARACHAAVPQLVIPASFDQPDNADRLCAMGVAAQIPMRRFTAARAKSVAAVMRRLTEDGGVAVKCAELAVRCEASLGHGDGLREAAGHVLASMQETH